MVVILQEDIHMNKFEERVMSFCLADTTHIIFKTSLKANPMTIPSHKLCRRKTSLSLQRKDTKIKRFNGSMTVEAAMAVPLFLFFIANMLSLFIMYESYCKNLASLHQEAKFLALASHTSEDDDVVELVKYQNITPIFKTMGFNGTGVVVNAGVRKWTGYNLLNNQNAREEEEYVYVTESGTVYHRKRDCRHLKITLKLIEANNINFAKNRSGGSYKKCEICMKGQSTGMYFVTESGNKYHGSASCSGLKRTIKTVKLSEVGGKGACSSCGSGR